MIEESLSPNMAGNPPLKKSMDLMSLESRSPKYPPPLEFCEPKWLRPGSWIQSSMKRFSAGLPPRTIRSFRKSPAEATPGTDWRARLTSSKVPGSLRISIPVRLRRLEAAVSGRSDSLAVTVTSLRRTSRPALTEISRGGPKARTRVTTGR